MLLAGGERTAPPGRPAPARQAGAPAPAAPSMMSWLRELAAVVGPEAALLGWSRASAATGCHGTDLTARQLESMGRWLAGRADDPALRMAAASCLARLRAHAVRAEGQRPA